MLAVVNIKPKLASRGGRGVAEIVIPENTSGKQEAKANSFAWREIFKKPVITFLIAACAVNASIPTSL